MTITKYCREKSLSILQLSLEHGKLMPFLDTKETFAVKDDTNDIFLKPSCQPKLQVQNLLLDQKLFACVGNVTQ